MRLFADHCIHTDLVEALRRHGLTVVRASEAGLARADDETIFRHVLRTSQVLLTADKDFGNIVRFDIRRSPGVVLLNIDRMPRNMMIRRCVDFFTLTKENRLRGTLWIVGARGIKNWPR